MNDKNVTLDRIEFEKLIEQSKAERAEYMRQCGTAALGVVGSTLCAHHVIAVVAVLLISFGVKMFFSTSAPTAEANIRAVPSVIPSSSMNVIQIHRDIDTKSLPVQKMNDKTFIFTDEE
jgi:hypothetical protein